MTETVTAGVRAVTFVTGTAPILPATQKLKNAAAAVFLKLYESAQYIDILEAFDFVSAVLVETDHKPSDPWQ